MPVKSKSTSPLLVIIAFTTVYIVWGSTYFFIKVAITGGLPPFLLGAIRFFTAGALLMIWCVIKGEKIFLKQNIINSAISGILLLFVANGSVIWSEQVLPSGMVAIMVSCPPIWFVLMDKINWRINLTNRYIIIGLIIGFAGVILLFSEQMSNLFAPQGANSRLPWMFLLLMGTLAWAAGSLYSKYKLTSGPVPVNTAWQMIAAGLIYIPCSFMHHEFDNLHLQNIPGDSWFGLVYLIFFGSIAAFSAYVWLLQVCPAIQVSTYAYVNPVIAVLLGVVFAHEKITPIQIAGLFIILISLLLINLAKYNKEKTLERLVEAAE